jgi:hypothetical protein
MGDVEDIKPALDRKCLEEHCQTKVDDYNKCLERIKSVPVDLEPHCFGWYFEIVSCVDHCAADKLWASLK